MFSLPCKCPCENKCLEMNSLQEILGKQYKINFFRSCFQTGIPYSISHISSFYFVPVVISSIGDEEGVTDAKTHVAFFLTSIRPTKSKLTMQLQSHTRCCFAFYANIRCFFITNSRSHVAFLLDIYLKLYIVYMQITQTIQRSKISSNHTRAHFS